MALRVGIVGAGHMGNVHAGILAQEPRVKIVGVVDTQSVKRNEFARRYGIPSFPSLDGLLDLGIDILYITTPNTVHTEPTIKALERNIHVFCEKPFATNLDEARQIVAASTNSKAVYQGGHNRRFAPAYRFLKDKVDQGFVPYLATIKMNDGDLKDPAWLSDRKKTGGFLYETTIHLLDIALWLMGDAVEVRALAKDNLYPDLVDWAILIGFEKGGLTTLTSSGHASWHFPTERVELVGDHASLITEGLEMATHSKGLGQVAESMNFTQLPNNLRWGYVQEDEAFVTAVLNNSTGAFSAEDGWKIVQLIEACYRSTETGKTVYLK
jgi:myo-inositol 2-dehydrogenase/D-chiro-inositol 1-dehydrogenase